MGAVTTSTIVPFHEEVSDFDGVSMQQNLLFSDSLEDLRNLRVQLYSAAEYFEVSYTNEDKKQTVVETLKDYAIKALVNTVDHLGSVTYKVNDFLDEKVDEVSETELRVSCIEQRLRTSRESIDHEGLYQQSLVINTPKYHKRYILPVGETMCGANCVKSKHQGFSLDNEDVINQFRNAARATTRETPPPSVRKGRSQSPSPRPLQRPGTFSFSATMPKKEREKRSVSPYRFPLLRSGSLSSRSISRSTSRSTTPNPTRPNTQNTPSAGKRYPSAPRKSASMCLPAERESSKDIEKHPSRSRRILKSLLSRGKSKKDDMLYTYLDEY